MDMKELDLAASGSSTAFGAGESGVDFTVQVTWPATAAGVFELEATNEDQMAFQVNQAAVVAAKTPTYSVVGQLAVSDGANAGSVIVPFHLACGRFRVKWTRTSGNGKAYISPIFARTR